MFEETYKALGALSLVIAIGSPFVTEWRARRALEIAERERTDGLAKEMDAMRKAIDGMSGRVSENEGGLHLMRLNVAQNYVPRAEIEQLHRNILEAVKGVSERLDRLLDRRGAAN